MSRSVESSPEPLPLHEFAPSVVGQFVAVADSHLGGREVLGTVVACWPERGPTWAIRLHERDDFGAVVVVYCYETPTSKLGRWVITRIVPATREERYAALVAARKAYDPSWMKLSNPATIDDGVFDSTHVGPWTMWAHDPAADLMVVGQDWGDVSHFRKTKGLDKTALPTNTALSALLAGIGRPVPPPPAAAPLGLGERATCRVWLTNALLWLKEGGLSSAVERAWFEQPTLVFLQEQIALVQPRVVVAMGERAYATILKAYDLPPHRGGFRSAVETTHGHKITNGSSQFILLAVYHCGARVQNTVRPSEAQRHDWERVRDALGDA